MRSVFFKNADPFAFALYTRLSDVDAIARAEFELRAGAFTALAILPDMPDAESVFDYANLESVNITSMNPGDVIAWADGRRELCLGLGWAMLH